MVPFCEIMSKMSLIVLVRSHTHLSHLSILSSPSTFAAEHRGGAETDAGTYAFCIITPLFSCSLFVLLPLQLSVGEGQNVTLELVLSDTKAARRRVILSTVFSEPKATALHCQVRALTLSQ
mgnify:CR=1 FL=1